MQELVQTRATPLKILPFSYTNMPSEITPLLPPKYLQQEESLPQHLQAFISTLPTEKGWLSTNLYQYQGFWFAVRHLGGVISCQKNFQARDSDIFLVTTPKSGTTWLKAIIFAIVNRTRYPLKNDDKSHPLMKTNPHDLVPFLEIKLYADDQIPDLDAETNLFPRLFATHLPYISLPETIRSHPACKIVYLSRNPKDTFISLWHFTNKLMIKGMAKNSMEESLDKFCRGVSLFGPFWDHVRMYWNLSREDSERTLFLRFEDVKENPGFHVRRVAEFLGRPFSGEEERCGVPELIVKLCSFENLSGLEVNRTGKLSSGEENNAFFRRGEVGDWKSWLDLDMAERIDQITAENFGGCELNM